MKIYNLFLSIISFLILFSTTTFAQNIDDYNGRLKKKSTIPGQTELRLKGTGIPLVSSGNYVPAPQHRNCGTMEADAMLRARFPELGSLESFQNDLQQKINTNAHNIDFRDEIITLPVIVHVVHNGEPIGVGANIPASQVQSQIDVLNEDYGRNGSGFNDHPNGADIEIRFALALVDPDGNVLPEPGIHRISTDVSAWDFDPIEEVLKPNTIWNPDRYCNMWTLQFGGSVENLLGYAQFPSASNLPGSEQVGGAANTDGVVIRYQSFGRTGNVEAPYNLGRTTTHEIGHWLGLFHIWGDGDCGADDYCGDTPNSGQPNYSCVTTNSCSGDQNDMIENYMDYTPDGCMNIFTNDQKTRVRMVMENSPRRKALKNSTVHEGGTINTNAPVAIFSSDRSNVCVGQAIQFNDISNNNPTSWQWEFFDEFGNPEGSFSGQNQSIFFNTPGLYTVKLTVSNAAGTDEVVEDNYITVLSDNIMYSMTEDFENTATVLDDWVLYNPDADRSFDLANTSSYGVGSNSIVFDNYSTFDDPSGTIDALVSPPLNLSSAFNPYFYFEYAYAQYNTAYSDTLLLLYSIDCGASFEAFWVGGGSDLATAESTENAFVPNSNQWSFLQVSLGFLAGYENVHIMIANISGWGNNLYLDQINYFDGFDLTTEAASPDFFAGQTQVCAGDLVQFQDFSTGFPNQWNWQLEGASIVTSSWQHPLVQYNSPGNFDVTLSASNAFGGNSITATDYIQVVPLPDITIFADQTVVCGGEPVTLTATGATTYEWLDQRSGTQISEGNSITVTLYEDWSFKVVGYNELGCANTASFDISVSGPTMPAIIVQGNNLSTATAHSYQWYVNGTPIAGAQGGTEQTITPTINGTYIIEVFDQNGCAAVSNPITVDLSTATEALEDISTSIKAFPNPTDGTLQVMMENDKYDWFELRLVNTLGQQVFYSKETKKADQLKWELDLRAFPNGIYFLNIAGEAYTASKRIVKQ